jgi:cobalt-zinc-cadmium efflux system protein
MSKHSHESGHDHAHDHGVTNLSYAFFGAIAVNIVFVAIETFFGFRIHSLALLSDAGHNAMDVLSLVISGVAIWTSRLGSTETFTYGYRRAGMLATLVNSVLLILTASYIIIEAIDRFSNPVETVGGTMMAVAAVGIIINGAS